MRAAAPPRRNPRQIALIGAAITPAPRPQSISAAGPMPALDDYPGDEADRKSWYGRINVISSMP